MLPCHVISWFWHHSFLTRHALNSLLKMINKSKSKINKRTFYYAMKSENRQIYFSILHNITNKPLPVLRHQELKIAFWHTTYPCPFSPLSVDQINYFHRLSELVQICYSKIVSNMTWDCSNMYSERFSRWCDFSTLHYCLQTITLSISICKMFYHPQKSFTFLDFVLQALNSITRHFIDNYAFS